MRELGTLGVVLALATTPRNLLLWGGLLIAFVGMYIVGERPSGQKEVDGGRGSCRDRQAYF